MFNSSMKKSIAFFSFQIANKSYSPDTINWDEEAEIRTSGGAPDMDEEKEPEIIELHHQLANQISICVSKRFYVMRFQVISYVPYKISKKCNNALTGLISA